MNRTRTFGDVSVTFKTEEAAKDFDNFYNSTITLVIGGKEKMTYKVKDRFDPVEYFGIKDKIIQKHYDKIEAVVDYLIDIVGEASPKKAQEIEKNLDLYANDHVLSMFCDLGKTEANVIVNAAIEEYKNY